MAVATLSREALCACTDLVSRRVYRYVLLRRGGERRIEVDRTSTSLDYEQFLRELPEDRCRWAIYDFAYTPRRRVILVTWLPGPATIKERLLYTAGSRQLRAELPGIDVAVHAEDRATLSYATLSARPH